MTQKTDKKRVVLAFSGGLDTSFCLLYLQEARGYEVVTVTVDTGGFSPEALAAIEGRAHALGAVEHRTIDGTKAVFDDHIRYLIFGNVRRGQTYPLCVGAERVAQARAVAALAHEVGAQAIAHGSTGAGNDQIRFDVAIRALCPDLEIITPIRDEGWSRPASAAWLAERGVLIPTSTTEYSVNEGLWGVTIGGKETHDPWQTLPEGAWAWTRAADEAPAAGVELVLSFERGVPTAIDGAAMDGVALVRALNELGGAHGVGRGMHVGDTILGIKGRVAFEAPAAAILLEAHRELEKMVLSRWQQHHKDMIAASYGMLLHEAGYFDPVMRDFEAFLESSQAAVSGEVRVRLAQGKLTVVGVRTPYSMMSATAGTYGERNTLWSGDDARGFAAIFGTQSLLAARARSAGDKDMSEKSAQQGEEAIGA
ncbi:MAG: argininosuccinate synthase [Myxococcales bacterium]|nr:argininosuccinate synthase [Myxococcales bacterium]